ncbi:hypothetical protein GTU99_25310 [Streptomyces sp. PRKS01-65]|nr:PepSY domain-containing protein [Streptomyces harenosi]NEY35450.1 hypothetical protein [Streptomyces harenosi]
MRSVAVLCALGGSTLLLAACGNAETTEAGAAAPAQTTPAATSPSLSEDQAERKDLVPKAKVTWDKAAATAVGEVPRGKLTHLELKRTPRDATSSPGSPSPSTPNPAPSPGAPAWAAEVAAEDGTIHRVDIDAVNGKVFRTQADPDQDADDKREITDRLGNARQSPEQAVRAATGRTKGTVTGVELDENDDRRLIWSVDVVTPDNWNKTTYDVDASSGRVLREHVDRD